MLELVTQKQKREIIKTAVPLLKSGVMPTVAEAPEKPTRVQLRQAQRALGDHGTKTAKKNPQRHQRRLDRGVELARRAVVLDEALALAKNRVEHPIKSRLVKR